MKKISLIILGTIILLTSCGRGSSKKIIVFEKPEGYKEIIDNSVDPNSIKQTEISTSTVNNEGIEPNDIMLGTWIGEINGKKLTIIIEKINGNELIGYNTLGSNKRSLKGTFATGDWDQSCSIAYDAILNEPGDDKWDGVFTVKFVGYGDSDSDTNECLGGKYQGSEGQGEWKSNNGKMKKDFTLTKNK